VVDDDPGVRELTRRILGRAGSEVLEAESGLQALELLDQGPVDAVIADIRMPGMDGWELSAYLKNMRR
jgi:CheY-like chemotaxis protein